MNEVWLDSSITIRFNIPGMHLFSVKFSGLVLDTHFSTAVGCSFPAAPFKRFPPGVEAVWIPSHPVSARLPRLSFQPDSIRYVPSQYERCWIDLRGTFEEYARKFSSKSRWTLRRKLRKFAQLCEEDIFWRTFSTPAEMEEFYRDARRVSSLTYQETLWNAGLPDDGDFRRQVVQAAVHDHVRGYILYYGRSPVAYMFCRARNGFLLYEYVGHDPYFQSWSPGDVLLYLALKQLFAEGKFSAFDFGPEVSPHKKFFSNQATACADIYYFPRRLRIVVLLCVHSGFEVASDAARSLLGLLGIRVRAKRFFRFRSGVFRAAKAALARIIRNPVWDLRYGAVLKGVNRSRFEKMGAAETVNTDYAVLPLLFRNLVGESDVLADVGCGKGRVINWWLSQGWSNKLIGIELDPWIAEKTRARLRKYPTVTILTGDVVENIPPEATIFYLYHPFHWPVMGRFKNRLLETFGERGGVVLVYYNCTCIDLFKRDSRWEIQELDLRHPGAHPAAIIRMKPPADRIP
jgi:Acetyltransferase (GNAT) domain